MMSSVYGYLRGLCSYLFGYGEAPSLPGAMSATAPAGSPSSGLRPGSSVIDFYDMAYNPATEFLGNFHQSPVTTDLGTFACGEAAFQAEAYRGFPGIIQEFQRARTGDDAYQIARKYTAQKAQNTTWVNHSNVRLGGNYEAMKKVLIAKFSNPYLQAQLLATGDAYLNEHNVVVGRDAIWSDNCDGTGLNLLGELLMWVRGYYGGTGIVAKPVSHPTVAATHSLRHRAVASTGPGVCLAPGCGKTVWVNPQTQIPSNFCGRTHAKQWCCKAPDCGKVVWIDSKTNTPSQFCGRTHMNQWQGKV